MKHTLSTIPPFEISRGFNARFVHTDSMTLAFVEVDTGAALPNMHYHILQLLPQVHPRITPLHPHQILRGSFKYQVPPFFPAFRAKVNHPIR